MRTILLAVAVLILAGAANAQATPLKIHVSKSDGVGGSIVAEVNRLISQDPHFALDSSTHYDVNFRIVCQNPAAGAFACGYTTIWSPDDSVGVISVLDDGIAISNTPESAARILVGALVQGTTADKIAEARNYTDTVIKGIMQFVRDYESKKDGA